MPTCVVWSPHKVDHHNGFWSNKRWSKGSEVNEAKKIYNKGQVMFVTKGFWTMPPYVVWSPHKRI